MMHHVILGLRWLGIVSIALAIAISIALSWQYRLVQKTVDDNLATQLLAELELTAALIPPVTAEPLVLSTKVPDSRRLTLIDTNGAVLFDTKANTSRLDNHNDRPEIIDARKAGTGLSRRHSDSIGVDYFYVAQALPDGRIIRIAAPVDIETNVMARLIQPMAIVVVVVILLTGCVLLWHIWRDHTRVAELVALSRALGDGDHSRRAHFHGEDTLSRLGHELNALGDRLRMNQEELNRSQMLLETALGSIHEGVACIDDHDRILYSNSSFRQLAAGGADVIGQQYYEHIPVLTVNTEISVDHRRRHMKAVLVAAGKGVRVVTLYDLTEIKRLEGARRDFIASVSHELKTPLTVIMGFTETLLDGAIDQPEVARDFVGKILHHAERLAALVQDVLTLSRLERGSWDVKPHDTDLSRLARDLIDEYQPQAATQHVTLELNTPEHVPAFTDPELLRHLVGNLLSNAIRYNRQQGQVRLAITLPDDDHIRLEISDTGIGIPVEHQQRIFERFYRVDSHRSRQNGGTGLGLSIVKQLVEILEGTIELTSSDQGSTFTVLLPKRCRHTDVAIA